MLSPLSFGSDLSLVGVFAINMAVVAKSSVLSDIYLGVKLQLLRRGGAVEMGYPRTCAR